MYRMVSFLVASALFCNACSTLDQSFRLGGTVGALSGAAATYAAGSAAGTPPTLQDVGVGASIGFGIGLITAYFVHEEVAADRDDNTRQTEIYFGDLPPSPFVLPRTPNKKGSR